VNGLRQARCAQGRELRGAPRRESSGCPPMGAAARELALASLAPTRSTPLGPRAMARSTIRSAEGTPVRHGIELPPLGRSPLCGLATGPSRHPPALEPASSASGLLRPVPTSGRCAGRGDYSSAGLSRQPLALDRPARRPALVRNHQNDRAREVAAARMHIRFCDEPHARIDVGARGLDLQLSIRWPSMARANLMSILRAAC